MSLIPNKAGKLFIVSASSGAGKTTLVNALLAQWSSSHPLTRVVTYTTRPPRVGDAPGHDYHFISESEFKQKIEEGFFLEWSNDYGAYYGLSGTIIQDLEKGCSYIIILDQSGALKIKQEIPEAVTIWISVSSLEILKERLYSRNTENKEEIIKRLMIAQQEFQGKYEKNLFKYSILNDIFEKALQELEMVIKNELFLPR